MPNQPIDGLIPEYVDAQLPTGTCLRFCFDEPLMTSDAGLLLLAELAAQSGDIAPKVKAPASGVRGPRAPEQSTQGLITQRVMQMIGGYPDGNDSNLLRHDPVLQMLVGKATPGTAAAPLASQPTMIRLDNGCCLRQFVRAFDARVDNFIASYAGKAPVGLVLDRDPTTCIIHGQQERGMLSTRAPGCPSGR